MVFWVTTIGGILAFGAGIWFYVAIGKRISEEEKETGKDLTHEANPFSGSAKGSNKDNKK